MSPMLSMWQVPPLNLLTSGQLFQMLLPLLTSVHWEPGSSLVLPPFCSLLSTTWPTLCFNLSFSLVPHWAACQVLTPSLPPQSAASYISLTLPLSPTPQNPIIQRPRGCRLQNRSGPELLSPPPQLPCWSKPIISWPDHSTASNSIFILYPQPSSAQNIPKIPALT